MSDISSSIDSLLMLPRLLVGICVGFAFFACAMAVVVPLALIVPNRRQWRKAAGLWVAERVSAACGNGTKQEQG